MLITPRGFAFIFTFRCFAPPQNLGLRGAYVFFEYFFCYLTYRSKIFGAQSGRVKTSFTEKIKCIGALENFYRTFEKKVWTKKLVKSTSFLISEFLWKPVLVGKGWLHSSLKTFLRTQTRSWGYLKSCPRVGLYVSNKIMNVRRINRKLSMFIAEKVKVCPYVAR